MFAFKLIAVQEFVHIKQHKAEKLHQENCQICHTIFQVGKFQAFDTPETFDFHIPVSITKFKLEPELYNFLYFHEINPSELFNRPPPVIS